MQYCTKLNTKATLKRSRTLLALVQHDARVKSVPVNKCMMRRRRTKANLPLGPRPRLAALRICADSLAILPLNHIWHRLDSAPRVQSLVLCPGARERDQREIQNMSPKELSPRSLVVRCIAWLYAAIIQHTTMLKCGST
jgi:hypothetical protein